MRQLLPARVLFVAAVAVAWGVAAGCSSFSGDSPTEAPTEAGADAPTSVEGGGPSEPSDAADAAPRFCKTGAAATSLFCADFDEGPLAAGWQLPLTTGGTLGTTPSDRSPPNAFLASIDRFDPLPPSPDAGDAGEAGAALPYGAALLSTSLGRGLAKGATLDFDLRIDALPAAGIDGGTAGGLLAAMAFDIDTQSVNLSFFQGALYFVVQDPALPGGRAIFAVSPPSPPRWFHVRMMSRFDGSGAQLSFDGIAVASPPAAIASTKVGLVLYVGPSASAPSGKARLAYDNVVLTLQP